METWPPSTTTTATRVTTQSITRAIKALLKWRSSKPTNTNLKISNDSLFLVLTLVKIPPNFRTPELPIKIPLPHSLFSPYSSNFRICILVQDKFSQTTKQKIENENLPISDVIKLSKFRSDFNSFDKKKQLCDSFDLFLADKSVISTLPKLIGRCFYKRKKGPVAVELGRSDWKEQIEGVCSSAMFDLKMATCNVIRVARASMEKDEIVENVLAAVNGVAQIVPKKWKNVRSFHLKFSESLALPIYDNGDGNSKVIDLERGVDNGGIVGKKRKKEVM